jgi:hypothetical protein
MTNNSEICIRFADKSKEKIIGSITEFHGILLNLVFDKEILCFCGNTAFSIFLCNMNFCNVNYEENILGLFFKKNESSLACNENESDSQGNGHSSVESQESISRMSISIYDEIETCIDREDRSHISPTTDDIFMMSEEAKHVCLVLHPIQVQKGQAYSERRLLRQTMKAGRFSLIWIHMLSNMCKMNRLQTMHQNLPSTKIQKLHVNPT